MSYHLALIHDGGVLALLLVVGQRPFGSLNHSNIKARFAYKINRFLNALIVNNGTILHSII